MYRNEEDFQPTPIGNILTRIQGRLARPVARKKTVWRGRPGEIKPMWAILGDEPPYNWQPPETPVPRGPVPLGRGGMNGPPNMMLMAASDESDSKSKPESGAASPGISTMGPPAPSAGPSGEKPAQKAPKPGGTSAPNPGITPAPQPGFTPAPKPSGLEFLGPPLTRISDGIDAGLDRANQEFQKGADGSMLNQEYHYRFQDAHRADRNFPHIRTAEQALEEGFVPVPDYQNASHRIPDPGSGVNDENNSKMIFTPDDPSSPLDLTWELVFDENGNVVTRPTNRGTVNVGDPNDWGKHFVNDVAPGLLYGNAPNDPTSPWQRARAYSKGLPGWAEDAASEALKNLGEQLDSSQSRRYGP